MLLKCILNTFDVTLTFFQFRGGARFFAKNLGGGARFFAENLGGGIRFFAENLGGVSDSSRPKKRKPPTPPQWGLLNGPLDVTCATNNYVIRATCNYLYYRKTITCIVKLNGTSDGEYFIVKYHNIREYS